jgi:long-chain acyl-CoA synthetase
VEIAMEEHPMISQVAVIGIPDQVLGQRVKAFIVAKETGSITAEEIKKWMLQRMCRYKVPEFYEFVNKLPRTPSGKVQKFKLRNS